jgi:hypothetical protein
MVNKQFLWLGIAFFTALRVFFVCSVAELGSMQIQVGFPGKIPTEDLTILHGFYGKGLLLGETRGKKGIREYTIPVPPGYSSAKLIAYCPGYQIAQISDAPLDEPWSPEFKKLPTTPIKGMLADTKGNPIAKEKLVLSYLLDEAMSFFGYADGMVYPLRIATIETKDDGTFQIEIPLMEKDPFFQRYPRRVRRLRVSLPRSGRLSTTFWMIQPETIPLQIRYTKPVRIQCVKKGKLSGHIGRDFLKKNEVTGGVRGGYWPETETNYRIKLDAETKDRKRSYNCMLKKDYTFSVFLPPGEYDLRMSIFSRGYVIQRRITVRENVRLIEGDNVELEVE